MRARRIIRVQPPAPLGEVTVAPAALTGRAEADVARAMAAVLADVETPNAATYRIMGTRLFHSPRPAQGRRRSA